MFYLGFWHFSTKCCACCEKWARGIRSAAPATRNPHHVPNQWQQFHQTRLSTLSKRWPKFAATKNDLQNNLSFRPTPANILAMCRKCHACHTDDKVSDVPHLSRKTTFHTSKFPYSTTPATKNGHCSKTDHCAPVKVDLHKGQNRVPHFVRACANKSRDHKGYPDVTRPFPPIVRTSKNPSVWTHFLGKNNYSICIHHRISQRPLLRMKMQFEPSICLLVLRSGDQLWQPMACKTRSIKSIMAGIPARNFRMAKTNGTIFLRLSVWMKTPNYPKHSKSESTTTLNDLSSEARS